MTMNVFQVLVHILSEMDANPPYKLKHPIVWPRWYSVEVKQNFHLICVISYILRHIIHNIFQIKKINKRLQTNLFMKVV